MITHLIWALFMPSTWLWLLVLIAWVLLWRQRIQLASRILAAWLIFFGVLTIYPMGNLLLKPLEDAYPMNPVLKSPAWLVLLGGGEDIKQTTRTKQLHLSSLGTRYITLIGLAKQYPHANIIVSGGVGHVTNASLTEAQLAKQLLVMAGIDKKRIFVESQSHNTIENAVYSQKIMANHPQSGPVVLVTSAAHMPRSMGLFCAAGMKNITPYPTDYLITLTTTINLPLHVLKLNFAIHEWLGLFKNWVLGYSHQLWDVHC